MTSFTVYEDYTPPLWSARPTVNIYFEIIRNGIQLEKILLDQKAMYLVGKNSEICDIVLDNPAISRKHAVIQNKNTNESFIYDLGSQNGTYVNNRKIPSKLFHKLNIFDSVRFGASTRIYIFRSPQLEEEDSVLQEKVMQDRENRKKAKLEYRTLKDQYINMLMRDPEYSYLRPQNNSRRNQQEDEGVSWGMIDEQEIYRYQQEQDYPLEASVLKQLPGLNETQLDRIKKYDEKYTKFRVVQDELDELNQKERNNFGLEESLKKKKEKLQNKQIDLSNELDQADEQLRFYLFGDKDHQKKINQIQKEANSSDEDEFYDNTLSKKQKKIKIEPIGQIKEKILENTTKTYQELKKQLDDYLEARQKIQQELLDLNNQNEKAQLTLENEQEDALDVYMQSTVSKHLTEYKPKLLSRLQEIQGQIETVSQQLKLVKPDLEAKIDFKEIFKEKNDSDQINAKQQENQKVQTSTISSTLTQLKQISKKIAYREEDDEEILQKANKYFEELSQKEKAKERAILMDIKRKERLRMLDLEDKDENKDQLKEIEVEKKQFGVTKPIPSRHQREGENEDKGIVDIVQFQ